MAHTSVKLSIPAAAEQVWETLRDFGGIKRWVPGVASLSLSGAGVGAVRTITFDDGSKSVERLESLNDASRSLAYAILESSLPVAGYIGSLTVKDLPVGCEVEWYSTFGAKGAAESEATRMVEEKCRQALAGLQKFLRT